MLHGESDPIPIEAARVTADLIGAALHPLPRCGHVPYVEALEEFVRAGRRLPPRPEPDASHYLSSMARPTPFDLVFATRGGDELPSHPPPAWPPAGHDPADRDAFLMDREVVTLLRDLRPDEGLGEAMDQLVALVHHAYLTWDAGAVTIPIARDTAERGCSSSVATRRGRAEATRPRTTPSFPSGGSGPGSSRTSRPSRSTAASSSRDPHGAAPRARRSSDCVPDRPGFSAVEATGRGPAGSTREDGSALFAPTLPGRPAAGLRSIIGEEELLELGWRTQGAAAAVASGAV